MLCFINDWLLWCRSTDFSCIMRLKGMKDSDLKMRVEKPASDQTVPRIGDDGGEIFPAPVCKVMTEPLMEANQDNVTDFYMNSVLTWSLIKQRKSQRWAAAEPLERQTSSSHHNLENQQQHLISFVMIILISILFLKGRVIQWLLSLRWV